MSPPTPTRIVGGALALLLLALLLLPIAGLVLSAPWRELHVATATPLFRQALSLSLKTTLASLTLTLALGTPLAWWLAQHDTQLARLVGTLVDLPVLLPPAVMGVALLQTFGRQGWLGPLPGAPPFSAGAVVLAQLVVASPFYVQAAANAFRKVDPDTLIVARTLGATPTRAFLRVTLPIAAPGLAAGASLSWARALGEFGATLLFAGNLGGTTQTMPLAIFTALETDVRLALVLAVLLTLVGGALLLVLRLALPRDAS